MYINIPCCPKCGHELDVIALYTDPPQYKYECRNPNCDHGKEYSSDSIEDNEEENE